MHTVWWHIIRLICAAHFHVTSAHIDEIYYWGQPGANDPSYVWTYVHDGDCLIYTWGKYDVCLR